MRGAVIRILVLFGILVAAAWLLERVPTLAVWLYYDDDHRDARIIREAFAANQSSDWKLDVSTVFGGEWQVLCVIGGYENPVAVIDKFAGQHNVSITLAAKAWSRFRVGEVPEPDMALAYVARNGKLRVYRLRGQGHVEHLRSCTTSAASVLRISF